MKDEWDEKTLEFVREHVRKRNEKALKEWHDGLRREANLRAAGIASFVILVLIVLRFAS